MGDQEIRAAARVAADGDGFDAERAERAMIRAEGSEAAALARLTADARENLERAEAEERLGNARRADARRAFLDAGGSCGRCQGERTLYWQSWDDCGRYPCGECAGRAEVLRAAAVPGLAEHDEAADEARARDEARVADARARYLALLTKAEIRPGMRVRLANKRARAVDKSGARIETGAEGTVKAVGESSFGRGWRGERRGALRALVVFDGNRETWTAASNLEPVQPLTDARFLERRSALEEAAAEEIVRGTRVRGPDGREGVVFWTGTSRGERRVGFKDATGETVWAPLLDVSPVKEGM